MNKKLIPVVVLALGGALLLTLLFVKLTNNGQPATEPAPLAKNHVWVATHNLAVGALIRDADIEDSAWAGQMPPSAFGSKDKDKVVGRPVVSTIYQGEPILDTRLGGQGSGGGLGAIIPPGMRAVPIRVNEITGVAGFVLPGMKVDVLIAGNAPNVGANLGTLSKTLLQDVLVLSAGQSLQKDAEGKPLPVTLVNLLVTPEQAETLSLANTEKKLQLVLRNPIDDKIVQTKGTAVANLFSGQKYGLSETQTPRVHAPAKRAVIMPVVRQQPDVVIEVIQGGARASVKFKEEGQ